MDIARNFKENHHFFIFRLRVSAPHDVLIVLTAIDMTRTKPTQEQLSAYFFNNCDPNEALFVENWFYHHGKSSEATELLHQLWVELGTNEFHEDIPDIEDAFENFKSRLFTLQPVKQKPSLYQRLQLWFKRSAVVMFIPLITSTIALYIFNHRHGNIQWVEKTVAYGEIEKLNLPDGSVVWLNSGSTIIYPSDFLPDVRQVFFEGEGYFDVVKNTMAPMEIHVKGNLVQVHGTSFNLKAYKDEKHLELSLIDGAVSFSTADSNDEKHHLAAGESLTYDAEHDKVTHSCFYKDNVTIWNEGGLYFKNKTLEEIVRQLERTYDIKIIIVTEELREIRYHMAFVNNESIDEILQFIDNDSRIIVTRKGDVVEIY